jgi:hypothetical protein
MIERFDWYSSTFDEYRSQTCSFGPPIRLRRGSADIGKVPCAFPNHGLLVAIWHDEAFFEWTELPTILGLWTLWNILEIGGKSLEGTLDSFRGGSWHLVWLAGDST